MPKQEDENRNNTRALIFVNGRLPSLRKARRLIRGGDWLVAADGGARHLLRMGLMPDLVVGDMDSLTAEELAVLEAGGARLERYPREKDETDLELALRAVLDSGWRNLCLVGALGGRLDQTLGNIFLLAQPLPEGVDLRLDDGVDEVMLIRTRVELQGEVGDCVSLLPLGAVVNGITTCGLRYPLRGETLFAERTRGMSNEMLDRRAVVDIKDGVLICVHSRTGRKR